MTLRPQRRRVRARRRHHGRDPDQAEHPGHRQLRGPVCHTARFPKEPIDFTGQRVAVIGTGATGVQTIQEVAKTAKTLTNQLTPTVIDPNAYTPEVKGFLVKLERA